MAVAIPWEIWTVQPPRRSDGALPGLRAPLPWPSDRPFRILSIDGGGIRGILPAAILDNFEQRFLGGRSAGECFDLIAGTSTGGIIALGLSIGLTARSILDLYLEHGADIFPPIRGPFQTVQAKLRWLGALRRYRYERAPLEALLRNAFGDRRLEDAQRRLCIPAFDGAYTEVHIFKTPHHPDFKLDWSERLVDVALATSAAPTYFAVYKNQGRQFADGGVWANNPMMIGLVDALSCNDLARRQVHILSLGCGESQFLIGDKQVRLGGLWHWREIISAAMRLQGQNTLGQAGLLIGRDQLLRIDPPPDLATTIEMDDYDAARLALPSLAAELASSFADQAGAQFFTAPAEPYRAFHGVRAN